MRHGAVIAWAFLSSCSSERSESAGHAQNGSWSKIVDGLQARLSIARDEVESGTPIISVFIEFRNVADDGHPLTVGWDGGRIARFSLVDSTNEDFVPAALAYDGFSLPLANLIIPSHSSMRFYASKSGAGIGDDLKALIDLGPNSTYEIKSGDAKVYFLGCTLTADEPAEDAHAHAWHGVLRIPSIAVVH